MDTLFWTWTVLVLSALLHDMHRFFTHEVALYAVENGVVVGYARFVLVGDSAFDAVSAGPPTPLMLSGWVFGF